LGEQDGENKLITSFNYRSEIKTKNK